MLKSIGKLPQRRVIAAIAVLILIVGLIPLIGRSAANPSVIVTKTLTWCDDKCRTVHVELTVKDNGTKPRPIDIVLLRDITISNKATYQGKTIDYWLDRATDQLINRLYSIPNADVRIAYGTYTGPTAYVAGANADATKRSNFLPSNQKSTLQATADTYGSPDPSPDAPSDSTNMERAISLGRNMLSSTTGARSGAMKVMLLLTDGFPTASQGQLCYPDVFVQANNIYIQAARAEAAPFLADNGKLIYFSMMSPSWPQSYFDRVAETESKIASTRDDGSRMAYRADLGSASLSAQVDACAVAMTEDIRSINTIHIVDSLTSPAVERNLAGSYSNLTGGLKLSTDGKSVYYDWSPSTTGATWTGGYDIKIPADEMINGYPNFPISSVKVSSYNNAGLAYVDTREAVRITVPAELQVAAPTVTGSIIYGDTMTLKAPTISGGSSPFTVKWTRNIDSWTATGQTVNVVSTGDCTYTARVYDAQTCYTGSQLLIKPPRGNVIVRYVDKATGELMASDASYTISDYSGKGYTTSARSYTRYTLDSISGNASGEIPVSGTAYVTYRYAFNNASPSVTISNSPTDLENGDTTVLSFTPTDPNSDTMSLTASMQFMGLDNATPGKVTTICTNLSRTSGQKYTYTTAALATGYYRVSASVTDQYGLSGSSSRTIQVKPRPADLDVTSLTTDKSQYKPGETVTVSAVVANLGETTASNAVIRLTSSPSVGTQNKTVSIGAGSNTTVTYTFTAPSYTTATAVALTVTADATNIITESNESNNSASRSIQVLAALPDLTITNLSTNASTYEGGDTITVTATIKNQGNVDAAASTMKLAYGSSSTTRAVGIIADGGTATVTLTITAPIYSSNTTLTLTATADSAGVITELDETNNTRSTSVTVLKAKPDLVISALTTDASTYDGGDTITVTATIKNQGYASAAASTLKLAYGSSSTAKAVGTIAVGGSSVVTLTITAPIYSSNTTLTLMATADSAGVITELDETNNTRSTSVTVLAAKPDLIVSALTTDASTYEGGDTIMVTALIKNQGHASAAASTLKLAYGSSSTTKAVSSIATGGTFTVTLTITAPIYSSNTTLTLMATADSAGVITELDETNNTLSTSVTVLAAKPDLIVSALTTDASTYDGGDIITVTATVRNQGYVAAAASTLKLAYGSSSTTKTVGAIAAGGTSTVTLTIIAPIYTSTSSLALTATADSAGVITELDETNNTRSTSVTVLAAKPDLIITSLTTAKGAYESGDTVTVTATVLNQGNLAAGSFVTRLTTSPVTSPLDKSCSLAAGASTTLTYSFIAPSYLTATPMTLTATADATGIISEFNETNNTKTASITINALRPDLTVTAANTTDWYAGMEVLVAARVANLSAQPVPSVAVRLTVGSTTVNETIPVPGNGSNLAVFRFRVPSSPGTVNVTIKADPDNLINEINESNNQLSQSQAAVSIPPTTYADPDEPALESYFQQHGKTVPALPATSASNSHSWQEIRLEGGSYNLKTYWATLSTVFTVLPDPRIARADRPGGMESGFGATISAKTTLSTNYDKPAKLIGPQMLWLFYPESVYGQAVQWPTLHEAMSVQSSTSGSTSTITWEYPVNPVSTSGSRLHFTPLWFPDNTAYTTLAQAFYGWSPLGQMIDYATSSVTIQGDMYDRITVIRMR